jgi:hypothetical protein
MSRRILDRFARLALALPSLALTAGDPGRDTLDTRISAQGKVVTLEWSKKHPWQAQLEQGRAFLVAEYVTARRGLVAEPLRQGARHEDRSLRWVLPDQITGVPEEQVCLFVQMQDRRVLPIRKVNAQGDDTSRFAYAEWGRVVSTQARSVALRMEADRLRREVGFRRSELTAQEAAIAAGGWKANGCEVGQAIASGSSPEVPFDVVESKLHSALAKRVCVMRVWNAPRLVQRLAGEAIAAGKAPANARASVEFQLSLRTGTVQPPPFLDFILQLAKQDLSILPDRSAQLAEFRSDWQAHAGAIEEYKARFPNPHFGLGDDYLSVQSTAVDGMSKVLQAITANESVQPQLVFGYVGSALESYHRCVREGQRQLLTKLENWQRNQQRAPVLDAMKKRDLVEACQAAQRKLTEIQTAMARSEEQLREVERQIAAMKDTGEGLLTSTRVLNGLTCSPRATGRM